MAKITYTKYKRDRKSSISIVLEVFYFQYSNA